MKSPPNVMLDYYHYQNDELVYGFFNTLCSTEGIIKLNYIYRYWFENSTLTYRQDLPQMEFIL